MKTTYTFLIVLLIIVFQCDLRAQEGNDQIFNQAGMLSSRGDNAGARELLTQYLESHPENTRAMIGIGHTYLRGGEPEKSIEFYERAYDLGDKRALTYLARGLLTLGDDEKLKGLVEDLKVAVSEYPDDVAVILFFYSIRNHDKDLFDWAYTKLNLEAARLDEDIEWLIGGLTKFGYVDEAKTQLDTYVKLHPENSSAVLSMGHIQREKGDDQDAIVSYEKAYSMGNIRALQFLATALDKIGNFQRFEELIGDMEANVDVHSGLAEPLMLHAIRTDNKEMFDLAFSKLDIRIHIIEEKEVNMVMVGLLKFGYKDQAMLLVDTVFKDRAEGVIKGIIGEVAPRTNDKELFDWALTRLKIQRVIETDNDIKWLTDGLIHFGYTDRAMELQKAFAEK